MLKLNLAISPLISSILRLVAPHAVTILVLPGTTITLMVRRHAMQRQVGTTPLTQQVQQNVVAQLTSHKMIEDIMHQIMAGLKSQLQPANR